MCVIGALQLTCYFLVQGTEVFGATLNCYVIIPFNLFRHLGLLDRSALRRGENIGKSLLVPESLVTCENDKSSLHV